MAYYELFQSAIGPIFIGGSDKGLHRVDFLLEDRPLRSLVERLEQDLDETAGLDREATRPALTALAAYFTGASANFDLPLAPRGTRFQERVWKQLEKVSAGKTTTYGAIARSIRRSSAARAVGAAIGRNPLAIVVPCHRVLPADGSLGGYASGVERKRWLLDHEARWR